MHNLQKNGGRSSEGNRSLEVNLPVNIREKIKVWELSDQRRFEADFALAPKQATDKLANNENLLLAWKNIKHIKSSALRRDIRFLEGLHNIQTNSDLQKHIFKGDMDVDKSNPAAPIFKSKGMHYHKGLTQKMQDFTTGEAKIKGQTKPIVDPNLPYKAKIQMYNEELYIMQKMINLYLMLIKVGRKKKRKLLFSPLLGTNKKF